MAPIGRPETSSNIRKQVRHTNEVPENESEEHCVGGTSERSNKKRARNLKKVVHLRRTRYYGSIGRGGKAPANFEKENNQLGLWPYRPTVRIPDFHSVDWSSILHRATTKKFVQVKDIKLPYRKLNMRLQLSWKSSGILIHRSAVRSRPGVPNSLTIRTYEHIY